MFTNVVVDVKNTNVDIMYTYHVPTELEGFIGIGSRVMVSFGVRHILGYVLDLTEENKFGGEVKDILEVLDYGSELSAEQVELAKFIKEDTKCMLVSALEAMYPSFIKTKYRKYLYVNEPDKLDASLALLFNGKNKIAITSETIKENPKILKEIKKGNLELVNDIYQYGKNKKEKFYSINPAYEYLINSLPSKRYEVMSYVFRNPDVTLLDIKEATGASVYLINQLVKEEYLQTKEDYVLSSEEEKEKEVTKGFSFTFSQKNLIEKFTTLKGKPFLLFSNNEDFKLDFYLSEAIKQVLIGKKVEIVAPTVLEAFKVSKFFKRYLSGYKLLIFTNDLSNTEYYDGYLKVIKGDYDIIITTKVGALLPVYDLGLLVVINEGDFNYLSEYTPKINLVNVLKKRSEIFDCKFVMSASNPQVETYYQYAMAKTILLREVEEVKNNVTLIDLNKNYGEFTSLSDVLINKIKETLLMKKQVVLMLNAKGYSNYVVCRSCDEVLKCPKCKIPLTYYKDKGEVKCRYCGRKFEENVCPSCHAHDFHFFATGLDALKENLMKVIPNARVLQMDSDTIKTSSDYHDALLQIENQDVDIIIGTRNVLSIFSNEIRLIGIIDIDQFLNGNDYRSSENTYQLINECMSHKECETIIQGHHINNPLITNAIKGDYDSFYNEELIYRKRYLYPPFAEVNRVIIVGPYKDMYYCANYLKKIVVSLLKENVDALGPVYITKLKGVQVIIKHNDFKRLSTIIDEVSKKFSENKVLVSFERYPRNFS